MTDKPTFGAKYDETAIVPSPWTKFGLGIRRSSQLPQPRENNFSWPIACAALFLIGVLGGFAFTSASYVQEIYAGKVSTPQGVFRTEKVGP